MASVAITSPTAGVSLSGAVTVAASYSGSGFVLATLTVDGVQVGGPTSAQPIKLPLDTTQIADGAHTIGVSAKYRRGGGYRWAKAAVSVNVANHKPPFTVTITGTAQSGKTLTATVA